MVEDFTREELEKFVLDAARYGCCPDYKHTWCPSQEAKSMVCHHVYNIESEKLGTINHVKKTCKKCGWWEDSYLESRKAN